MVELVHIPNLGLLPSESAYIHQLPQKLRVFQSLAYSFFALKYKFNNANKKLLSMPNLLNDILLNLNWAICLR
jgi:hypothetical protein